MIHQNHVGRYTGQVQRSIVTFRHESEPQAERSGSCPKANRYLESRLLLYWMRSCFACDGVLYYLENHDSKRARQYKDHDKIDNELFSLRRQTSGKFFHSIRRERNAPLPVYQLATSSPQQSMMQGVFQLSLFLCRQVHGNEAIDQEAQLQVQHTGQTSPMKETVGRKHEASLFVLAKD